MWMTPFAAWLQTQMRLNNFGQNRSKLARYLETGPSTVRAWFEMDVIPRPPMCKRIAEVLKVPEEEVLRIAGHLSADHPGPGDALPSWLRDLLPLLTQLDETESLVLEYSARGLLELREARAAYQHEVPQPPPHPAHAEQPPQTPRAPQ